MMTVNEFAANLNKEKLLEELLKPIPPPLVMEEFQSIIENNKKLEETTMHSVWNDTEPTLDQLYGHALLSKGKCDELSLSSSEALIDKLDRLIRLLAIPNDDTAISHRKLLDALREYEKELVYYQYEEL